jgi:hypothetical protein
MTCRFEPCRVQTKFQSHLEGDYGIRNLKSKNRCYLVSRFYSGAGANKCVGRRTSRKEAAVHLGPLNRRMLCAGITPGSVKL